MSEPIDTEELRDFGNFLEQDDDAILLRAAADEIDRLRLALTAALSASPAETEPTTVTAWPPPDELAANGIDQSIQLPSVLPDPAEIERWAGLNLTPAQVSARFYACADALRDALAARPVPDPDTTP